MSAMMDVKVHRARNSSAPMEQSSGNFMMNFYYWKLS